MVKERLKIKMDSKKQNNMIKIKEGNFQIAKHVWKIGENIEKLKSANNKKIIF